MSVSKGKCYLKRKRFLNEVSQEILTTLQRICFMRNEIVSDSALKEQAQNYAQKIEAVCLTPKYKMSNDEYHNVLVLKTQELCDVLKRTMLPNQSSPIPISANQQQQSIQLNPQESGIDLGSFNEDSKDKVINNNNNTDQMLLAQDTLYDAQLPSEVPSHPQQLPAPIQSQATLKKTRTRKNNLRPSASAKLNLNQGSLPSLMAQYQPEKHDSAFGRKNIDLKHSRSNIENDVTNKYQLNCNNYNQDLNMYDEAASNMGDFVEIQKNCSTEGGASNQGGNAFLQSQSQNQLLVSDVNKAPPLRYDFEQGSNDSTTIFSIATKDADLFPVTEGNFNNADAFSLPDESFFDNGYLKDGLDFSDQMSFNFM